MVIRILNNADQRDAPVMDISDMQESYFLNIKSFNLQFKKWIYLALHPDWTVEFV